MGEGIEIKGEITPAFAEILTGDAVTFLAKLARTFTAQRDALLTARKDRQALINAGNQPDFLPDTQHIRESAWQVAPVPVDLQDRRVEITGPTCLLYTSDAADE